jgi:uncharacterized protein (TIGR00661 family)
MKIVYGVSGEGLGHVFEAIEIVMRLQRDGHSVKVLTFGDRAMHSLAPFAPTRIEGVHLRFNERGLSLARTFPELYRVCPFYLRSGISLIREIADFQPDVFITAYEPFSNLVSHLMRRPLISMDNQNELRFMDRPAGADRFAFNLARLVTRIVTAGAARYIIKTFERRAADSPRVRFVDPGIQMQIRALHPYDGDHVLVYLTKPNPALVAVLKTVNERFIVYCGGQVGEEANLVYRAPGPRFLGDLEGCKAIIGTTGFSLIADSIFLKKPYFGVPLKKQFEQTHNAIFLKAAALGDFSDAVTRQDIERFLARLPEYRRQSSVYSLNPCEQEEALSALVLELGGQQAGADKRPSKRFAPELEQGESVEI